MLPVAAVHDERLEFIGTTPCLLRVSFAKTMSRPKLEEGTLKRALG